MSKGTVVMTATDVMRADIIRLQQKMESRNIK